MGTPFTLNPDYVSSLSGMAAQRIKLRADVAKHYGLTDKREIDDKVQQVLLESAKQLGQRGHEASRHN